MRRVRLCVSRLALRLKHTFVLLLKDLRRLQNWQEFIIGRSYVCIVGWIFARFRLGPWAICRFFTLKFHGVKVWLNFILVTKPLPAWQTAGNFFGAQRRFRALLRWFLDSSRAVSSAI
jgi:hypothetical protein